MDTTKRGVRGWKEAQRQGEFADFSIGPLLLLHLQFMNYFVGMCGFGACIKCIKFSVVKRGIMHLNVNLTLLKVLEESY
jgi:hypothetical protein